MKHNFSFILNKFPFCSSVASGMEKKVKREEFASKTINSNCFKHASMIVLILYADMGNIAINNLKLVKTLNFLTIF